MKNENHKIKFRDRPKYAEPTVPERLFWAVVWAIVILGVLWIFHRFIPQ